MNFDQIINKEIAEKKSIVLIDGYIGVDWTNIIDPIKEKDNINILSMDDCYKAPSDIKELIAPFLTDDPFFGKVYEGAIEDFLNTKKVKELTAVLEKRGGVVVLYGPGAVNQYTKNLADIIIYVDIAPEELIQRTRRGEVEPFAHDAKRSKVKLDKNAPGYLSTKRFHYVDFPLLNNHRKNVLKSTDYYIDANEAENPKIVSKDVYNKAISEIVKGPFRPVPHYDPAPWGGQWLKKVRNLKNDWPNVGWSYDLIAPDMAVRIPAKDSYIEVPFISIVNQEAEALMGPYVTEKFNNHWPIRVNYDDTLGNKKKEHGMGIHVHPPTKYVRDNFKEKWGQQESYYMLAVGEGATVYLGLKEDADLEEFSKAAKKAEDGVPFDYEKYLNAFPAKEGDLFLIPTGTVHSGKNVVVLEISATTVRYTLRIYDYLRPDLSGNMRHIATHHAFKVIDPKKRTKWIKNNLIQKPRRIRGGENWTEYTIGKQEDIFFEISRIEFKDYYPDETGDRFHLLTLAKGEVAEIIPDKNPQKAFKIKLSETVIVPATTGPYKVRVQGDVEAHIVKSMVK
ncbi:MAG: class I mannose-6-phosphate isomerase [Candidatus Spechtbacterales bacterium]|nr:class I mannose-6-phosphate isomerase [Candidatus Spechtbacterales bacterium]